MADAKNPMRYLSLPCRPVVLAAITTLFLGIVYVGGTWTPSHYGAALALIGAPEMGPTVGTARSIASDEWAIMTPYFQMSVANGLGEWNANSPYHEALRTWITIPTSDWSILFKPQLWGFLVLPPEYAYSLYYFIVIASFFWSFSVLLILSGIERRFAIFGTLIIFFSHFTQVWWVNHAPIWAFLPWPLVAALAPGPWYLRFILVAYAAAVWLLSSVYPPFIIGGAWAMGVLLIAFRPDALRPSVLLPAGCAALAALGLVAWYLRDSIPIMQNTVFPGSRISTGGGVNWLQLLSHIFPYVAVRQFEPTIPGLNACEIGTVSSYLPLIIATFADYRHLVRAVQAHRWTAGVLGLGALLSLAWIVLPVPAEMGQIFLWNRVPPIRLLWPFGLLTTVASIWIASIVTWRISILRVSVFLVTAGTAWLGFKQGPILDTWFDGVILVLVALVGLLTLVRPARVSQLGLLLVGSAAMTSAVTFGTFNPLQSARPIFQPPETPFLQGLRRPELRNARGWIAVPGDYGAVLAGLGLPTINHDFMQPQLKFFRGFFPNMEANDFNTVFNRAADIVLELVDKPQVVGINHIKVPITEFAPPIPAVAIIDSDSLAGKKSGRIESLRLDHEQDVWKLWIKGWIPPAKGQRLEIAIPKEIAPLIRSVRAVRIPRRGLTSDALTILGSAFAAGGFIVEIGGADTLPAKDLLRTLRVFSVAGDGLRLEVEALPAVRLATGEGSGLATLPIDGNIDQIYLDDNGRILTIAGWIAPPRNSTGQSIDEIVVALNIPAEAGELTRVFRPDVVKAKAADSFFTGFTISLRLPSPLQTLPTGGTLCVAASSAGRPIGRAGDNQQMQCH